MSRRAPTPIVLLALALACTGEGERSEPPSAQTTLSLGAATSTRLTDATAGARPSEILLGAEGDRALFGSRLPVAAEDLAFVPMRVSLATRRVRVDVGHAPLLDAALIPGTDGLLILGIDRTLSHVTPTGIVRLDEGVVPGLACAPDGKRGAYAKGDMPELDVWEIDLETRAKRVVANADGPEHTPFYSASGDRVAWVGYPTGRPKLLARSGDVVSVLAPSLTEIPDGRRVPIWRAGFVAMVGQSGVRAVAETSGEVLLDVTQATDLSLDGGAPVVRVADGSWHAIEIRGSR